jgi:hypothetical protein
MQGRKALGILASSALRLCSNKDNQVNEHEQPAHDPLWPPITSACRPWTRWWWMGSAVDEAEITRQLQLFHAAGIGGVEISPIYGVTGEEARSIPFLSSRWIHMQRHADILLGKFASSAAHIAGKPLCSSESFTWLDEHGKVSLAQMKWDRGYSFDFVSDRLLEHAIQVSEHQLQSRGGTYRALVVAGCTLMPPETLERILALARAGATVVIVGDLPNDVPGLGDLAERRRCHRAALSAFGPLNPVQPEIAEAKLGNGRILVGADIEGILQLADIRRESVVDAGVEVIRRRDDGGYLYFLANLGQQRLEQWISLSVQAALVAMFDPVSTRYGLARMGICKEPETLVYLQLEPGESIVLRTRSQLIDGPEWQYLSPAGQPHPIEGAWQVEFIAGGPTLPKPTIVEHLASWTEWPDDSGALCAFSGTARYTTTFEWPSGSADAWALDLGMVCHSARVRLNGQNLGTCYTRPFRLLLPEALREGSNRLEIEVTTLTANRRKSCN